MNNDTYYMKCITVLHNAIDIGRRTSESEARETQPVLYSFCGIIRTVVVAVHKSRMFLTLSSFRLGEVVTDEVTEGAFSDCDSTILQ